MGRLVRAVAVMAALCTSTVASAALAAQQQPRAQVQGELAPDLRAAIVTAIGQTDRPVDNRFEARRRARDAAQAAIAVLRSEGYYAYVVEPDVGEGDTPAAIVRVTPGPRFVIAAPKIAWVGAPPSAAAQSAAASALQLKDGQPGRAADVISAEGRAVAAVQKLGYADAAATPREVVVDHSDHTVRPTYRLNAGSLVRLDGVKLVTGGRTSPNWVRKLAPWKPGQEYDPELIAELQRRLLDPGVFDDATVALAPASETTPDGLRPVVVSLSERKPRTIELGASYGTTEGAGVDARWTRYNLLGRADTLAIDGQVAKIDTHLATTLTLPNWGRPRQTLTASATAYRANTDAYDQSGFTLAANIQQRFGRTRYIFLGGSYFTWGGSVDLSRVNELKIGTLSPLGRDVLTIAGLANLSLDRSDDPLDPTRGWRIAARADPTLLIGQGTLPYLRVQAQLTGYLPLGAQARTVLAGRVHIGSILNGTVSEIPAPQRFYAGGGGSVRGFAYQAVGPRLADGTPEGGLTLVELSGEVRHDLTDRWGLAAFIDAGSVGLSQFSRLSEFSVGAGVGVRYKLGFGPIRVDIATPVVGRHGGAPFELYVSLGQSF